MPELRPDAAAPTSSRSTTKTVAPASARKAATAQPTIPAPTTIASVEADIHPAARSVPEAELELSRLPAGDPRDGAAPARQRPVERAAIDRDEVVAGANARAIGAGAA